MSDTHRIRCSEHGIVYINQGVDGCEGRVSWITQRLQRADRADFDPRVRLEIRGTQLSSDGSLLVMRKLDDALGLPVSRISEFSPHKQLISGGEVTIPKLFVNISNGRNRTHRRGSM